MSLVNGHELENADHFTAPNIHNHLVSAFAADTMTPPRLEIEIDTRPFLSIRCSRVELCWNSVTNKMYQIQYHSTLTTNVWADLGAPLQGTGTNNCIIDSIAIGQPQRFYRVEELP